MSTKKLYALTDEHVEALKAWAEYGLSISTDHKELDETADASHALTPLDHAATVEHMARAILRNTYRGNVDLLNYNAWDIARSDARAALDALLGGGQA